MVEIDWVTMTVDLIPLDLPEFDVILGMDFLSRYRTSMDCYRKEVVLRRPKEVEVIFRDDRKILPTSIISIIKAEKLLSKGCMAYLTHVIHTQVSKLKPKNIPIIWEFLDVFPKNYQVYCLIEK